MAARHHVSSPSPDPRAAARPAPLDPDAAPVAVPAGLDPLDARLLDLVQEEIPFDPRPFRVLGERLGTDEADCLERLRRLRHDRHVIRQISAIFDTKALGYASSLVAARFAPERLEAGAAVLSAHPGVSHNYERDHAFNLWYTLAVPPDSRLGLQGTIDLLHRLSGAESTRALPTLRLFKIGVKLDVAGSSSGAAPAAAPHRKAFTEKDRAASEGLTLSEQDKNVIRVVQQDLPLVPEPFAPWASEAGCDVAGLLEACRRFEQRRQMRRFAAVLHHREAGFGVNAMGVWRAPDGQIERLGAVMANFPAVSHCYRRPSYPDWPFNLYTMIHGRDDAAVNEVIAAIAAATGITEHDALHSLREFKKVRVEYFTPAIPAWEAAHAPG